MRPILHTDYAQFADVQWDTGQPLPNESCVIHCHTDHIAELFYLMERSDKHFVLITSNSDYGIELQQQSSVEKDMQKWLQFVDFKGGGYKTLVIPSRCNLEVCKITDPYSVKMHTWTKATFERIPDNVVIWFGTNLNIQDPRIVHIPFGVAEWSVVEQKKKEKFGIYINLQDNNLIRVAIKNEFRGLPDVLIESNVSHEQFMSRLQEYPFILSPPGNGLDCFRTLESLYCGALPIIPNAQFASAYNGLPAIMVDSYSRSLRDGLLQAWEEKREIFDFSLDNTPADWYYWSNLIATAKNSL